jgi:tRNA(Arg) A34 adenosine deaminase TadA
MIPPTYKPRTKFMQLAIAEAKRARDRGDYGIGAGLGVDGNGQEHRTSALELATRYFTSATRELERAVA